MVPASWAVRLSATAESDFQQILRWTAKNFGQIQAKAYAETISAALKDLMAGPRIPGAKARPEVGDNLWTLHVARNGNKGRHFVLFRPGKSRGRDVHLSPRQIQRHLTDLEIAGFIKRVERFGTHKGQQSNEYDLDGLVKKLQNLEPEFNEVKELAKSVARPGGLAASREKKAREAKNE